MNLSMNSKNTDFESSTATFLSHNVLRFCSWVLIIMNSNNSCHWIGTSSGGAGRILEDMVVCITRDILLLDWILNLLHPLTCPFNRSIFYFGKLQAFIGEDFKTGFGQRLIEISVSDLMKGKHKNFNETMQKMIDLDCLPPNMRLSFLRPKY